MLDLPRAQVEFWSALEESLMIVFHRKLKGIIPYRLVYWPSEVALKELANDLPMTHYARVESANVDLESGRCIVGHHLSLTLLINLQRPLSEIYKDLIDNARIRIHKAEKLGSRLVVRRYGGGPDNDGLVPRFVDLYNDLVRGKASQAAPVSAAGEYSFFPHADLIMAYLDDQPICGHLNLVDREAGIVRLQHGANKRFDDAATARLAGIVNVYLHWHELEMYRQEGLATYDFGSIGQVDDSVGVNRFKMQFGGTIIREHNYLLAGMPLVWSSAISLMSSVGSRWQRRLRVQRAGDQWRDMTPERIRETIEAAIDDYQNSPRPVNANGTPAAVRRPAQNAEYAPLRSNNKHGKASQHT